MIVFTEDVGLDGEKGMLGRRHDTKEEELVQAELHGMINEVPDTQIPTSVEWTTDNRLDESGIAV